MGKIHQYLLILLVDIFSTYSKAMLITGEEKKKGKCRGYLSSTFGMDDMVCFENTL